MGTLAMAVGLRDSVEHIGHDDRVLVLREGAATEILSSISVADAGAIDNAAALAGIRSPEFVWNDSIPGPEGEGADRRSIVIRGLDPGGWELHDELEITEGCRPRPGVTEVAVGQLMVEKFGNIHLGTEFNFLGASWKVVGLFESAGNLRESEVMTDRSVLQSLARRPAFNSITMKVASPEQVDEVAAAIDALPNIAVDVYRESDFYLERSKHVAELHYFIVYVVGFVMGLGASLAALNSTYSAVAARQREIGTLRAIGFGPIPIVVSMVAETLSLAAVGAAAGALAIWTIIDNEFFVVGGA